MIHNILVTGGSGFLGRHLIKQLETENKYNIFNIKSQDHDLRKPLNINLPSLTYILHLAVSTKAGTYCLNNKGLQWEDNQLINSNIMYYWRHHQPQAKMVTFGTSCAYPVEKDKIEYNYLDGHPDHRLYIYAMTKRMLLIGLIAYAEQFNMKSLYFIPNTLYGPNFDITDSHFIFELIQKITAAKYEQKEPAILWGSGFQKRELIYIDDAVNKIVNNMHLENNIYNLATGIEYPIKHYAQIICDYIDYPFEKIKFDTNAFEGVQSKQLEPNPFIGPCNQTSLVTGIKNTINYYMKEKYEM